MLGVRSIGSRYLGAGRAIGTFPTPVSGAGSAVATATGTVSVRTPIGAAAGSAVSTGAGTIRRRGGIQGAASAVSVGVSPIGVRQPVSGAGNALAAGAAHIGVRKRVSGEASAIAAGQPISVARRRPVRGSGAAASEARAPVGRRRPVAGSGSAVADAASAAVAGQKISGAGSALATGIGRFPGQFLGDIEGGRVIIVPPRDPVLRIEPKRPIITIRIDDGGTMLLDTKFKQPAEIVDYVLDMRDWFDIVDRSDYIVSGSVSIDITGDPADLESGPGAKEEFDTIGASDPQLARIWLGGGRDGVEYKVTIQITTNGGRVEEVDLPVVVEEL